MLVSGFPAGPPATNCFVVAPGPGERCVVIDPGIEATGPLADLLERHRLRPAAVLLTHGHIDHTYSVVPVCDATRRAGLDPPGRPRSAHRSTALARPARRARR